MYLCVTGGAGVPAPSGGKSSFILHVYLLCSVHQLPNYTQCIVLYCQTYTFILSEAALSLSVKIFYAGCSLM